MLASHLDALWLASPSLRCAPLCLVDAGGRSFLRTARPFLAAATSRAAWALALQRQQHFAAAAAAAPPAAAAAAAAAAATADDSAEAAAVAAVAAITGDTSRHTAAAAAATAAAAGGGGTSSSKQQLSHLVCISTRRELEELHACSRFQGGGRLLLLSPASLDTGIARDAFAAAAVSEQCRILFPTEPHPGKP